MKVQYRVYLDFGDSTQHVCKTYNPAEMAATVTRLAANLPAGARICVATVDVEDRCGAHNLPGPPHRMNNRHRGER